jgi:hypothetical protein
VTKAHPTITCVLCNQRGPSANEDVVPRWLAKAIAAKGTPPYFDLTIEMNEGSPQTSSIRHVGGLPVPWKLPEVCNSCNNGWMSQLEQAMKHAGKRLVEGKHYLLSPFEQVVIATWMTKTALLYDVARGGQVVPLDKGSHPFYAAGQPLPRSQIMLAAFQPPDRSVVIPHRRKEHKLIDPSTGNISLHGVDISFVFGFLFIQLYVTFDGDEANMFGYPTVHPDLIQCWPVRHPVRWLPPLDTTAPASVNPQSESPET